MPLNELHRRVATVALRVATRYGFALGGGNALIAHGLITRPTQDVDLLQSLNDPALAYSGANEGVNAALQAAVFELLSEGNPGFFRNEARPAPHNLYANIAALWPQRVRATRARRSRARRRRPRAL